MMDEITHLLACLSEECVEVSKEIHKAIRFGLHDRNVLDPTGPTNRERIVNELNNLMAVIDLAVANGILPESWQSLTAQAEKQNKVHQFMEYAREIGALK